MSPTLNGGSVLQHSERGKAVKAQRNNVQFLPGTATFAIAGIEISFQ